MKHFKKIALVLGLTVAAFGQTPSNDDQAVQAQMVKGKQALVAHKYRDAEKAYKEALKLSKDGCRACYLQLMQAYWQEGNEKGALEAVDRAVAASSTDVQRAEGHSIKGNLYLAMGKDKVRNAEEEFRQALQLSRAVPFVHYYLALALMRQSRDDEGKQELTAYLETSPKGENAEEARKMMENPRRARERFAPEFTAVTATGEKVVLANFAGKVVVLDFWATWCPPCVASVPELKELLKKYPADKFVLISISADSKQEAWRSFIEKKEMRWTQVFDEGHRISESFGVNAYPTYMIIDGEGIIREQIEGLDEMQSVAYRLRDKLKSMPELNRR